MRSDRFLATVLFTDIVGSTERAAELGDRHWRELLQAHHALARREIVRHGGRELNMTGDGFLATFEAPERALRCACAIRDGVQRIGIGIRVGLHTGEIEIVNDNVGGIGVHIAARVLAAAAPGEILVSSTLRDVAAGSGFGFEDRGTHALKGIPGEWRLFAVASEPVTLPVAGFWERAREARLARVILLYLLAAAAVLALTAFLRERLGLPDWIVPAAVLLIVIGLAIVAATAWVQAHPPAAARGEGRERSSAWDVDLPGLGRSLRRGRLPHLTWGRSILGGVVAFSLLFGLAGLYVLIQDRGRAFSPSEAVAETAAPGIAVLPFDVRGQGLDVWREGMVDLLSTNLDGTAGLRAIDSRTVLARWRETVEGPAAPDLATALQVARRAGAKYALVGNVVSSGSDMRLGAEIYSVDGASLGAAQVEGSPDSVFALVDRLSIEALAAIWQGEEDPGAAPDLARTTTTSLPALKAYLEGESLLRRSDFPGAIAAYQRAIAADSTFAFALYHLGDAYGWSPELEVRITAGQYYARAARNAGRLTEREAMLVRAGDAFWKGEIEGVELLREGVRRYPDEAEAWYNLGEFYFHFGEQVLVEQGRSDEPFLKAVELDPSFAPFYIHLVNNAFYHADSGRASKFIQAYRRAAPNTRIDAENRIAFALVFGEPASRREARAALDTLSSPVLGSLAAGYLDHPRFWDEQYEVLTARPRPTSLEGVVMTVRLLRNSLRRGRLRAAVDYLHDPMAPSPLTHAGLYLLHATGLPVPTETLDRELALDRRDSLPADSFPDLSTFYAGAYAADRSRWDEHAAAVARLRSQSQRFLAQGDSAAAGFAAAAAEGLDGLALWRRGEAERALPLLQLAQTGATGQGPLERVNATIRWWLGTLHLESGRPREAARYFESFWQDPLAAYALGQAYEETGEYAKARQAYEFLASAWKDADPELQPRVVAARAAAQRLTSVIRE